MLFIMKSTKTIFAISSIRCIRKTLNSSSSCSHEQVYFSKKKNFYQVLRRKKKKNIQISGYAQMTTKTIHVHDRVCVLLYFQFLCFLLFFSCFFFNFFLNCMKWVF